MPGPEGDVMVIDPPDCVQVGCDKVTAGAEGVGGWALIVVADPGEMHPSEFFAVSVYDPGDTAVNIPVLLV
jgi:hypothetical protein